MAVCSLDDFVVVPDVGMTYSRFTLYSLISMALKRDQRHYDDNKRKHRWFAD